jgi:prepilin-type N-terminal cleavage/methylation domain-containing protein
MKHQKTNKGFTIVELLIVVVVIAILAAITIVAYNGIQNRAKTASVQADLNTAVKKLHEYRLTNSTSEQYPSTLPATVSASTGNAYTYFPNVDTNTYCLQSSNGTIISSVTSANSAPFAKPCSQHSLVGWWPLNGQAEDSSGNGFHGTVTGASLTTGQGGRVNGAYSFDGSENYILGTPGLVGNKEITMNAWAFVVTGTTKGTIFHVGAGNGYSIGLGTSLSSTNGTVTGLFPGIRWLDTSTVAPAGWRMLTLVLDTASVPSMYLDGVLVGRYVGAVPSTATNGFSIGRNTGDEGSPVTIRRFNSSIDDVRLFSRALSVTELQALYAAGAQ